MSVMINWRLPRPQAGGGQAQSCHLSSSCSARSPPACWTCSADGQGIPWSSLAWTSSLPCRLLGRTFITGLNGVNRYSAQFNIIYSCFSKVIIWPSANLRSAFLRIKVRERRWKSCLVAIISSEPRWQPTAAPRRLSCSYFNLVHAT